MSILFGIISSRLVVEANGCIGVIGDGGEDEHGESGEAMDDGKSRVPTGGGAVRHFSPWDRESQCFSVPRAVLLI